MATPWRVYGASAIGKGHIDAGLPCQDSFATTFDNERLAAVVCDGAGSASRSELGASECANVICTFLTTAASVPAISVDQTFIEQAVKAARARIEIRALEASLPTRELACTLVGVILFSHGGYLFHVGDGMAVVEFPDGSSILSMPENGEYSNETFFVTSDDWQPHLRITPFVGQASCICLMSDGAMPFAINREKSGLFGPFINPVRTYLSTVTESEGSEALKATLADERTWSITSDDKTLLVVLPL